MDRASVSEVGTSIYRANPTKPHPNLANGALEHKLVLDIYPQDHETDPFPPICPKTSKIKKFKMTKQTQIMQKTEKTP